MATTNPSKALKVLIVGGGVGGMSTAISLRRIGADVELIDIDKNWGALGAGITITGPTLRAFRDLGVLDEIMELAYTGQGIRVCDTQGNTLKLLDTPMPPDARVPGSGGISRPALHEILARRMRAGGVPRSEARTCASTGGSGQKKPTESGWFFE